MMDETGAKPDNIKAGKLGARPEDLRREHARVPASDETLLAPDGEAPPATDERRLPKHPVPPKSEPSKSVPSMPPRET